MSMASATEADMIASPVRDIQEYTELKGVKRTNSEKKLLCKKHKKTHKWFKKSHTRHESSDRRPKNRKPVRNKPEAPFNSTQFIMEEHDKLNDSDLSSSSRPRRNRDSSLSMDSDEGDFCTSEEGEEFVRRDFWTTFEEAHSELLEALPHNQLIQEYLSLEEKVSLLEREYLLALEHDRLRVREPSPGPDEDDEVHPGEVPVDAETAAKIEVFRNEIKILEFDNLQLKRKYSSAPKPCNNCHTKMRITSSSEHSSISSDSEGETRTKSVLERCHLPPHPSRTPNSTSCGEVEILSLDLINSKGKCKSSDAQSDSGIASFEGISSGDDVRTEKIVHSV